MCKLSLHQNNFYRPQTKFEKVMFLYLSVSHSIHRGEYLGRYTIPPGRYTPLGRYPPRTRYTPGRYTPRDQVHPQTRYTPWAGTPPGPGTPPGTRNPTLPRPGTPPGRYTPAGPGTPPPSRWLLLRTVRILLECILVFF